MLLLAYMTEFVVLVVLLLAYMTELVVLVVLLLVYMTELVVLVVLLLAYMTVLVVLVVLLLAYMNGNGNLCRAVVRAGACLGVVNKEGMSLFNIPVATKQLLFKLLGQCVFPTSNDLCRSPTDQMTSTFLSYSRFMNKCILRSASE